MEEFTERKESVELKSVMTSKFLAFILIATILFALGTTLVQRFKSTSGFSGTLYNWSYTNFSTGFLVLGPYIALLLVTILSYISPKLKLSAQQSTVLFAAVSATCLLTGVLTTTWPIGEAFVLRQNPPMPDIYGKWAPTFWSPDTSYLDPAIFGGVPVPWGVWMGPMAWWFVYALMIWMFFASWSCLVRRMWVDVERVTFPYAMVAAEAIGISVGGKGMMGLAEDTWKSRKKWVLIGVVFSIIFYIYLPLRTAIPALPAHPWETWPWRPGIWGLFVITTAIPDLAKAFPGSLIAVLLDPVSIALFYILPLDTLFTSLICWVVFLIVLPQVAYIYGLVTPGLVGHPDPMSRYNWLQRCCPYNPSALGVGAIYGLFIMPFVFSLPVVKGMLRSIRKPAPDESVTEALPYRLALVMLIVAVVLFLGLSMVIGAGIYDALITLILVTLMTMGLMRFHGEVGPITEFFIPAEKNLYWALYSNYGGNDAMVTGGYFANMYSTFSFVGYDGHGVGIGQGFYLMDSFRLASTTKTRPRDVLLASGIAFVITFLIVFPLIIYLDYTIGLRKPGGGVGNSYLNMWYGWPSEGEMAATQPIMTAGWWTWEIIAGFLVSGFLWFMRLKFLWWPFTAAGFVMGVSNVASHWTGVQLPAWLLKYVTVKVGGAKLYETKGVPVAAGIVIGYVATMLLGGIIGVLRFFFVW